MLMKLFQTVFAKMAGGEGAFCQILRNVTYSQAVQRWYIN